jgi:hypothetical protein
VGSIIYKNLAYPITYFAASSLDSDSLNTCMVVKDAYKSTLDNMNVGFFNGNTDWYGVKYNTDSSVLKGIWGGRPWITPGFTTSGSNKFAHVGTAPLYDTNCNKYQSGIRNRSTSTCYLCVTYYDNKLYWAKPTSATVPTSWTEASFGNYANVVLISMCGGGGGGGGGSTSNPLIGTSYACAGGGGGGGGWQLFLYKFDPASTSSNKTILCFTIGAGGAGGAGASEKGSGGKGSQGGTTYCRLNSFSGTVIAQCTGGYGGNGGVYDASSKAGGAGGLASTPSSSRTDSVSVCYYHGKGGGAGYGLSSSGKKAGGNGENFGGTTIKMQPVCEDTKIPRIGYGTPGLAAPDKTLAVGGGGGGASAISQGTTLQIGDLATIGLGGEGGVAQCYDSSGEWSGAGASGYSGIVEVIYEGAYKTLAEIDASY